jgi:tRNA1Val (adenine37-N6)-methyltransferase
MPNPYFQFKQFTIHQDRCAMKVSTDGCILGAWFAEKIRDYTYILDIGSGTGLLMLMLAQKLKSEIHGIEIDLESFRQLKENIGHNKWKDKCRVMIGDVRSFTFSQRYDFIISNPPFHENQLETANTRKNLARHSSSLTLEDLAKTADRNLAADGSFGVLLPYYRADHFIGLAASHHLYLSEQLLVRQTPGHDYFRAILHFTRQTLHPVQSHSLTIQEKSGIYTSAFTELLQDYYLKL